MRSRAQASSRPWNNLLVVQNHERYTHLRKDVRVNVNLAVDYAQEDGRPAAHDATNKASAIDLGGGGVRLATEEDLPLGTVLLLRFHLPTVERVIVARGRIVLSFYNANEQRYLHGIAFTQIDPRDQSEIRAYVEELVAANDGGPG
jgi:c-di-GMP-binding flagellar brake protein YcgR